LVIQTSNTQGKVLLFSGMAFVDERMFDSILRNLTTNAVKFTAKGGKVIIAAKPIPDGLKASKAREARFISRCEPL